MKKRLTKTKKVLIVAAAISSIKTPLTESFRRFGYEVYEFDFRKSSLLEKLIFAPSLLYPRLWSLGNYFLNQRLLRYVKKTNPNIVFVSKGETITSDTVKKINKYSTSINWFTDLFESVPRIVGTLPSYNFVFTVDDFDTQKYKNKMNIFYIPFASNLLVKNIDFKKRKYDVVFIGTWTRQREVLLSTLTNLNIYIWGDIRWQESKLREKYQGRWLTASELLKVFANAKIAINERQNKNKKYTMPNYRLFEATASGALVLTDYLKDLDQLFVLEGNKKEMVMYKNKDNLERNINFFLENESERIKIAKRGYKRSIKDHSYDERLKDILKIVKSKS